MGAAQGVSLPQREGPGPPPACPLAMGQPKINLLSFGTKLQKIKYTEYHTWLRQPLEPHLFLDKVSNKLRQKGKQFSLTLLLESEKSRAEMALWSSYNSTPHKRQD